MKKRLLILIGIIISLIAIYFSLRGVNWSLLPTAFTKMKLGYLFLLTPVYYFTFLLRAYRWKLLLPSSNQQDLGKVFDATILGFFATNILPLRAGEFIRPWIYSKWSNLKMLTCLASIIVERVFDVLVLLIFLAFSLTQVSLPQDLGFIIIGAKLLMLIALVISCVMIISYIKPQAIEFVVDKFCALFLDKKFSVISEKIKNLSSEFIQGFKSINGFKELALVVFSSLLIWSSMAVYFQVLLWAFEPGASFVAGVTITAVIALAVAAPSAPGFIGTFQFGCVFALCEIYSYDKEMAVAYSLIAHLVQYFLIAAHGIYILKKREMSMKDISSVS